MARVDAGDDSIRRFIVRHYRYDPERHERRHVVVDAFDNEPEFLALLTSIAADIGSGTVYEPGHRRRAATGHLVRRMMDHGDDPRRWVDEHDLPSNMALFGSDLAAGTAPGPVSRSPLPDGTVRPPTAPRG